MKLNGVSITIFVHINLNLEYVLQIGQSNALSARQIDCFQSLSVFQSNNNRKLIDVYQISAIINFSRKKYQKVYILTSVTTNEMLTLFSDIISSIERWLYAKNNQNFSHSFNPSDLVYYSL